MSTTRFQSSEAAMQIPPELLRSIPREVALTGQAKAAVGVMIALVVGAVAVAILLYQNGTAVMEKRRLLEREGVAAQAEVVRVGWTGGKNNRRFVVYRYEVNGRPYQGRTVLSLRDKRTFAIGAPVDIRYARTQRSVSTMEGYQPGGTPLWLAPVVALSMCIGPLIIAIRLRRDRALLAGGRPAIGRVTAVRRVQSSKSHGYQVWYEFTILSGAPRKGRSGVQKDPPAVGSALIVVYDPDRPERNARYPMQMVRTIS